MNRTRRAFHDEVVGDGAPAEAARRLGLSLAQFETCKHGLFDRGFPKPDITTGNYDLDAIDQWRKLRHKHLFGPAPTLTPPTKARDAREKFGAR
ncbi:hypothetical protein V1291_000001 [Nitrobacteraceae bacterium AZCC 1564]